MGDIVVFGATGYTGRLTVAALAAAGAAPLLAGRDPARLDALAGRYPGTRVAVADATDPGSVRALLRPLVQLASHAQPVLRRLPGLRRRSAPDPTGTGPDAAARARTGSVVIAEAYDRAGRRLRRVVLTGVNGYELTGRLLAWAARTTAAGGVTGTGALGPVQAFGLDRLEDGCRACGLARTE